MRKFLTAAALLAMVAGATASTADPLPIPSSCVFAPVNPGADGVIDHCEFVAAAESPVHGYVGLVPNDFVIYLDLDDTNTVTEGDTILADVSPTGMEFGEMAGTLDIEGGTKVDVDLHEACAGGPVCGWVGVLAVG